MSDNKDMKYSIRMMDISDPKAVFALAGLQLACLPGDKAFPMDKGWWHIVFAEGEVVAGFSGMVPSRRWTDCVYLCRAGILPEHQGNGLQKRLIRARVAKARALKYKWAVTDTYDNPASANSLIANKFKMFKPSEPWAGKGSLFWLLKL